MNLEDECTKSFLSYTRYVASKQQEELSKSARCMEMEPKSRESEHCLWEMIDK